MTEIIKRQFDAMPENVYRKERVMRAYRHGDLLLVATNHNHTGRETLPVNGRLVLLEGEATGHAHTVSPEHATLITTEQAGAAVASTWRNPDGSMVFPRPADYVLEAAS